MELQDNIFNFLSSKEGRMFLGGLASSVYLDYFESRALPKDQKAFYYAIKELVDKVMEDRITFEVFTEKLIEIKDKKEAIENEGERSLIAFLSQKDFFAKEMSQVITSPEEVNYKKFKGVEKNFMKAVLSEVMVVIREVLDEAFKKGAIEGMLNVESSEILH
jgi:hypothetical protein